jgi:hypothetical protein
VPVDAELPAALLDAIAERLADWSPVNA